MLVLCRIALAQSITIKPNQPLGTNYCNVPVFIAPDFDMTATASITGMKISFSSGYVAGEDEFRLEGYTGPVYPTWFAGQGYLTLEGSSNIMDYVIAIRKVQYINNKSSPTNGYRTITFSPLDADYLPATQHYYRFVSNPGKSWTAARDEAAATKYYGLQGYLATITSLAENNFIQTKTKGVGWIGASDAAVEGDWRWVTGPEGLEDSGQGRLFWRGSGFQAKTNSTYGPVNGAYHNWNRWSNPLPANPNPNWDE